MAERGRALISRLLGLGPKKRPYLAACEYWVYLPEEKAPPQDVLMGRMIRSSPFAREGEEAPIGPAEGLLFSDIRLHVALVLRSKNPHLFRPDLFAEAAVPTQSLLEELADAKGLVKMRFVSEEKLKNVRHLQFMPYLVEATSYYGKAKVAFDVVAESLFEIDELREKLKADPTASRPEIHVRTCWTRTAQGGKGSTKGLVKVGVPDLETPESPAEHETAILSVLLEAAHQIWASRELPQKIEVPYFGDTFEVAIEDRGRGTPIARVLRLPSA